MAGQRFLVPSVGVRVLPGQQITKDDFKAILFYFYNFLKTRFVGYALSHICRTQ